MLWLISSVVSGIEAWFHHVRPPIANRAVMDRGKQVKLYLDPNFNLAQQ